MGEIYRFEKSDHDHLLSADKARNSFAMVIVHGFRLWGHFQVADSYHDKEPISLKKTGVIDVSFAKKEQDIFGAFLTWQDIGDTVPERPKSLPDEADSVFGNFDAKEALLGAEEITRFWITEPWDGSSANKIQLYIRGAVAFQQRVQEANGVPELFWPCIGHGPGLEPYHKKLFKGHPLGTWLVLGQGRGNGWNSNFRFDLAIPSPIELNREKFASERGSAAIGITGVFGSKVARKNIGRPGTLFTGLPGDFGKAFRAYPLGTFSLSTENSKGMRIVRYSRNYSIGEKKNFMPSMARALEQIGVSGVENKHNKHASIHLHWKRQNENEEDAGTFSLKLRCTVKFANQYLDLQDQIGGRARVGSANSLCELEYSVSLYSSEIARRLREDKAAIDGDLEIHLRFITREEVKLTAGLRAVEKMRQDSPDFDAAGLYYAIFEMGRVRNGLLPAKSQPQSFLPKVYDENANSLGKAPWAAFEWIVHQQIAVVSNPEKTPGSAPKNLGNLHWHPVTTDRVAPIAITLLDLDDSENAPILKHFDNVKLKPIRFRARFENCITGPNLESARNKALLLTSNKRAREHPSGRAFAFFTITEQPEKKQQNKASYVTALGALEFEKQINRSDSSFLYSSDHSTQNQLILSRRARLEPVIRDSNQDHKRALMPALNVELTLNLSVDVARPATVDIAHGERERQASPLLIREPDRAARTATSMTSNVETLVNKLAALESLPESDFLLRVIEQVFDDQDWHLSAQLVETSRKKDLPDERYTILSFEPFSILRYSRQPLLVSGQPDSNTVAEYDSDNRAWRFNQLSETYHFVLPPAVSGESADKPNRLEIHDPNSSVGIHPVPGQQVKGITRTHVVDSRFAPPVNLWIRPSDLSRSVVLPEFASYDLFRQAGDFGRGVALAGLTAEFLYGLSVGVDPKRETGKARQARVADLDVLYGSFRKSAPETPARGSETRWSRVQEGLRSRPEHLEVWRFDPDNPSGFMDARFSEGTSFALRHTALHRPPVKPTEDLGKISSELRLHEYGLPGGALWPLESWNMTRALITNPSAEQGGIIEGIKFGPQGGSANQTARFLGGVVTIISETRNGFVQRQRVEILGRIAVFWHRAKHVVIYERTTAPSDQFAPEVGSETRTSRPVIRKVEEFVEVLQPVRRYPDFPDLDRATCGFLDEVRFNSKIIHVDSAWGGDTGTTGWRMPLWNRAAAQKRPLVYPFPDVAFATLSEGDDNRPRAVQECLDPANIFFFTDAEEATRKNANTDTWPTRVRLDCSPFGQPSEIAKKVEEALFEKYKKTSRSRRPSSSRFLPGMRPFTWRLAPAASRTQINAGRARETIFAALESITFMRSVPTDPEIDIAELAGFREQYEYASLATEKPPILTTDKLPDDAHDVYGGQLKAIRDAIANQDRAGLHTALKELAQSDKIPDFDKVAAHFGVDQAEMEDWRKRFKRFETKVGDVTTFDRATCEKLKTQAASVVNRKRLVAIEAVRGAQGAALLLIEQLTADSPPEWARGKEKLRKELKGLAFKELGPYLDDAKAAVGNLRENVEVARAIVREWRQESAAALARAQARADEVLAAFDNAKPWSLNRLRTLRNQVQEQVEAAREEAEAILDETRQRLSSEVDGFSSRLSSKVSRMLAHALRQARGDNLQLEDIRSLILRTATDLTTVLDKVSEETKQDGLKDKLQEVQDKESLPVEIRELAAELNSLRAKILSLTGRLKDDVAQLKQIGQGRINLTKGILDEGRQEVQNFADNSQALIAKTTELAKMLIEEGENTLSNEVKQAASFIENGISGLTENLIRQISVIDFQVEYAKVWIGSFLDELENIATSGSTVIEEHQTQTIKALEAAEEALGKGITNAIKGELIGPVIDRVIAPLPDGIFLPDQATEQQVTAFKDRVGTTIASLGDTAQTIVNDLTINVNEGLDQVQRLCDDIAGVKLMLQADIVAAYNEARQVAKDSLHRLADELPESWGDINVDEVKRTFDAFDYRIRDIVNAVGDSDELARDYVDRVINAAGGIGKGRLRAGPNNVLRLYSAVTQAPELAALRINMDRIRVSVDDAKPLMQTPKLQAAFDKLGDALKALGIEIPFHELGDSLKIDADSLAEDFDLGRCFGNIGGINLSDLFPSIMADKGWADVIDITHRFDKKAVRAWVQIDVDVPIGGRRPMFSIGPFTLFTRNAHFSGFVRAEASKDTEEIEQSDFAAIRTDLEAVVAGQVMVTLVDVRIEYSKDTGLNFKFDPKNIRINDVFRFIQDTLGTLFPGEFGGLKFIKQSGIPVGVEHEFKIPPTSLIFGTSGVTNIAISNRFSLVAYPDFVISNRFNLSRVEQPFIFSIFIIGGAGYIQVDTEYRPFDKRLMVIVEASAGGSAAFGFAFGPVSGGVYITLSVALTFRKLIGDGPSSGGLSVSLVLVIAGNMSLWGLVNVFLAIVLRMTYHSSGQIDALGALSVEVRVSRFFKLKYSTSIRYKLRDGQSSRQVSSKTEVGGEAVEIAKKAEALKNARKRL